MDDDKTETNWAKHDDHRNRSEWEPEQDQKNKTYKSYPRLPGVPPVDTENLRKFNSIILNEEIEGFNQIASSYTNDILTTMEALNTSSTEPVAIETRYEMPGPESYPQHVGGMTDTFTDIFLDLMRHNFHYGQFVGSILKPTTKP